MQLKIAHDIENNILSTDITVESFGTDMLSADEEKEILKDFPTSIDYRYMTFTKNVTMYGSVPVVTESSVGEGVVEVTVPPISNKEIYINEGFKSSYRIDTNKISSDALDASVLTTKELVAQAYCAVFDAVVVEHVGEVMTALRAKAPAFAGETLVEV